MLKKVGDGIQYFATVHFVVIRVGQVYLNLTPFELEAFGSPCAGIHLQLPRLLKVPDSVA